MKQPKLSIVIPTRNRYQTLFPVVDALIDNIIGNNYQIVISDNSDDNSQAQSLFSKNKYVNRVKYSHTAEALTQSGNSDRAISFADGAYVVFIGDDDLVSPYILKAVEMMELKSIECLIFSRANYYWEGVKFASDTRMRRPKSILFPKNTDCQLTELHSNEVLKKVLIKGGTSMENLPQQYHALVKKTTLDKVKEKFGFYVPGPCPDMTLAVSLSYVLGTYYSINYPFTITGVSKHSAAGLGALNQHVGRLEDQKFLPSNIILRWNPMLPKVWTAYTIWSQSIYDVMRQVNDQREVCYPELYARMFVRESYANDYTKPLIKSFLQSNPAMRVKYMKAVLKQKTRVFLIFWINIIFGGTPAVNNKLIKNIETPDECMKYLSKHKPKL